VFKKNSKNKIYKKCNVTKYNFFQKRQNELQLYKIKFNIAFSVVQ